METPRRGNRGGPITRSRPAIAERPLFAVLSIALLGVLAYSNTLDNAFVFDDLPEIVGNPAIRDLGDFLGSGGYHYNPRRFVAYLSFALNYRFGGLDVTGYHVVNLVVHVANAFLVYLLVGSVFQTPRVRGSGSDSASRRTALLAALLFVAHPLQTQAVTYVVQRITSLMSAFYLGSIVLYAKWKSVREQAGMDRSGRKEIVFLAASVLCMALAMKTKESAITLPAALLLYDGFFCGGTIRRRPVVLALILSGFLVVPLSLLDVQRPVGEILSDTAQATSLAPAMTRWEYLLTEVRVIVTYIRLIFLPIGLNLDHDVPISRSLFTPGMALSAFFLAALAAAALYMARMARRGDGRLWIVSFGILWFFLALSVESSVIPIVDVMFEHRAYLPSVGAFVCLATGFEMIRERWFAGTARRAATILVVAVLGILAVSTYQRNAIWTDRRTLWQDVVLKSPRKARGYTNLGAAMVDSGRTEEGIALLEKAISLKPDYPEPYNNLGAALAGSGRRDRGIPLLEKAISLDPEYPEAYNNLGAALIDSGRRGLGISMLQKAIALKADYAEAHFNLGSAFLDDAGKTEEAIALLTRAILLNPGYTDAHVNLGAAYNRAGRFRDAVRVLEGILRNHPDRADAHFNLGVAYAFLGNVQAAAEEIRILRGMDPGMGEKLGEVMSISRGGQPKS